MKELVIVSGKGGVGKSSITASLAVLISKETDIVAADYDVDASNLGLLLGIKNIKGKEISTNEKAFIKEKAKECKDLDKICPFSAIHYQNKRPIINKFLCEGCGACKIACPQGIALKPVNNARISQTDTKYNFPLISGQLKMGESGSGKIVDVLKKKARKLNKELIISDAPAGTGCPVISSLRDADMVLAVTEPTPTALSDLKKVIEIIEHFQIDYRIIINKHDINPSFTKKIESFAGPKLAAKIPYDKTFVKALVNMTPIVIYDNNYEKLFRSLLKKINI